MKKVILLLLSLLLFCGCQDKKNLLNLLFPTSMAIDYIDGHYHIALKINHMNSVSKSELESSMQNNQLLIATGEGENIEEALNEIEETERSVVNYSHVRSLILLPGAMDSKIQKDICNFASLNPQLRMDTDVYYSEEEMEKLYTTNFQVGRSELYSLSNSPDFKRISPILNSINLLQLAKGIKDKNITLNIPVLEIDQDLNTYISEEGEEKQNSYHIEKMMYFNSSDERQVQIELSDLQGIQWINSNSHDIDVNIQIDEDPVHAVSSAVNVRIVYQPTTKTYHLKGKISMVVTRDVSSRPLDEIEPYLSSFIHDEIWRTYEVGLEKGIDIYNMQYLSMLFGHQTKPNENNLIDEIKIETVIKGSYISANS